MKKLIFTDLDGTLLDLYSYSAEQVKDAVDKLKKIGISIIFCSSKTWSEQEFYLKELNLDEPVIVENGSGIFFPENTDLQISGSTEKLHGKMAAVLGKKYDEVVTAVKSTASAASVNLKYYHNQPIAEISKITGLSMDGALKARTRDFSETLFNVEEDPAGYKAFKNDIEAKGYLCLPGSKFVTICSAACDKGKAVNILIDAYKQTHGEVISYGIGDSRNDKEMLNVVDIPFLVQKPDLSWAELDVLGLRKIDSVGPKGWIIMAEEILGS